MVWEVIKACVIWFGFIGLLYVGCYAPTWEKKDKRGKVKPKSLLVRILYAIAYPITALVMLCTAAVVAKDVKKFIKGK